MLPEYNVLSWLGGSNGAAKANWGQLTGNHLAEKDAVIWPDNDLAGVTAATAIVERLNLANDAIGRASIIDTKALGLPEKWDLADQLPESLNINKVKDILQSSMLEAKSLDAANKVNEIIQGQSSSDLAQLQEKILWQQRSAGNILSFDEVKQEATKEQFWQEKLTSAEVTLYSKYSEAKGTSEGSSHEFLKLEHPLYSSTLAAIAKNIEEAEKDNLDFENKMEHMGAPKLLGKLQDAYELKIKTSQFAVLGNPSYQKLAEELKSSPDRQELFKSAVRDYVILYQEQMNSSLVSPNYIATISTEIHSQIKNYNKPTIKGSQSSTLETADKIAIHEKIYQVIQNGNWWKEKTTRLLDQTKQQDHKLQLIKEEKLAIFTQNYQDKFDDIMRLNPKYDIEQLKDAIYNLPEDKDQTKLLDQTWIGVFKDKVLPELKDFKQQKAEAKSLDEIFKVIDTEKDFCVKNYDEYPRLLNVITYQESNAYIMNLAIVGKHQPEILDNLKADARNFAQIDYRSEKDALNEINSAKDIDTAARNLQDLCGKYYLNKIEQELSDLKNTKTLELEKGGIIMNMKSFTEHCLEDKDIKRYLEKSSLKQELQHLHKAETIKEAENLQSLERSLSKGGDFEM